MDSAERYTATAMAAAAVVIAKYSTSFSLAVRLLPRRVRPHIAAIYALVRVADEVVDGACPGDPRAHLDALEDAVDDALDSGFSTDLIVHAFAATARATGFGTELTGPFFESMRSDIDPVPHTAESLARYIYGSAEVVGLMCLRAYLHRVAPERYDELAPDARRLGAGFQKVNFLRDLSDDELRLGRAYLPELTPRAYTLALADARTDLEQARRGVDRLPRDVQRGVRAASNLYFALLQRLESSGLDGARASRIRVPATAKLLAVARGSR